jgi:antitoxin VapB
VTSAVEKHPTAKLFMHGRSQAVRLPKEFRFEGKEVRVSRIGDKVILEPMEPAPIDVDALWATLDAMGARDFLTEGLPEDEPVKPEDFDLGCRIPCTASTPTSSSTPSTAAGPSLRRAFLWSCKQDAP